MFHTILFDLDGTLTDSREGIVNSVKYTIEKLGGTMPDAQTLLKFIGPPLQESFMEHCGYSREKAVEGVRVFREHYVPVGQYENEAAPGIRDVLERLKAKGYTLALASSKPEELCVSICRRFGFTPFLSAVTGSPAGPTGKGGCHPEAMRRLRLTDADKPTVLMVGDGSMRCLVAQECGLACVGVEFFGYAAPGELAEAGAARSRADGGGAGTVYSESLSVRDGQSPSLFSPVFRKRALNFLKIVIFVHISLYKIGELLYNIMAKVIYMEIGESVWL